MDEGQTPAEIARSLSEAQRRLILSVDDRVYSRVGYHPAVLKALFRKGVTADIRAAGVRFWSLTDEGLSVRAAILGEGD